MPLFSRFFRNQTANSQFISNVSSNVTVYFFNLLVAMWMTPYLIGHLGVALFGLIPLANSVTSYLSLLTLSLNGAVGRFLAIDLQKGDQQSANRTFNTSLVGVSTIALVSLPILALFSFLVPRIFNIPLGETLSAQLLFFFVLLSFFITEIGTSFSVSSWAKSRFDLRNRILIFSNVIRLIVLVALFTLTTPSAWQVGLGILIASLYVLSGDYLLWRKLTPELSIDPRKFDSSRVRLLFGMGGWMVINQLGSLLFLNIDLIVANIVLGVSLAGEYGAILLFSTFLRGLAGTVSGVFSPIVTAQYANGDAAGITHISTQAVRLLGLSMSLPIGLLCGLSRPLLLLWLGSSFQESWLLLIILSFPLAINLSVLPLFAIQTAFNQVKIPGLVTIFSGLLNLGLAYYLASLPQLGIYGIAIAGGLVLTFKNALFTPVYSSYIQKINWDIYLRGLFPAIWATLSLSLICYGLTQIILIDNWFLFFGMVSFLSLTYITIVFFNVLSQDEQMLIKDFFQVEKNL